MRGTLRPMSLLPALLVVSTFCVAAAIASSAQAFTTLVSFDGADGANPYGGLVQATDGNFYGTTQGGGVSGNGTVFKLTPGGTLTTLYSFGGTDGSAPRAGLIQATDGTFYGTTAQGGPGGFGTVFKITPGGILTTLHSFVGSDGETPVAALLQATDGNLYGTTSEGGASGYYPSDGTFYTITTGGTLTTLRTFNQYYDGAEPLTAVIQANDGFFYGTTYTGNAGGWPGGELFTISASGNTEFVGSPSSNGANPWGALIQATDGNLYGTASAAGAYGYGTVFVDGIPLSYWTAIHSFTGADGSSPRAGLIQASDGNFYGTTFSGGANNRGTVFQITSAGALTTLHSFTGADGANPQAALIQATDGNLYGTTVSGGAHGNGTVFELQVPVTYTITVSTSGNGTVTSTDGLINCPGICTSSYPPNTPVTLNATPDRGWVFGGWDGACVGTASCTLTMTQNLAAGAVFSQALQMAPVTPCRLVDTRQMGGPIQGGTAQTFAITQLGNCNISTTAAAYSLNVTVVPHGPLGYLTIWPTGQSQPVVSTMNSTDGRTKANAAIVPAGANGAVSVFASNTADVVLDINGYFASSAGDVADGRPHPTGQQLGEFYPLPPCRVIDTRHSNGDLGSPSLTGGSPRNFPVLESTCLQGISQPQAYYFNFTAVPTPQDPSQPLGYLTVWPQGGSQPTVSTLNNPTATTVANAAIVPAGTGGGISVFASNDTDMVVDINGYFAAPGTGGLNLYPVAPCRVLDTRNNNGQPFSGPLVVPVTGSICAPPASAQAYVFNATVVPSVPLGYLTLWPDGSGQPTVSTLNALDGFVTSNMAVVPSTNGSIDAFASNLTQLVLDISSYFAP